MSIKQIFHPRYQFFAVKRFGDIGVGPSLNALQSFLFGYLSRNHHDGNMVHYVARPNLFAHLQAVHSRHHAVGYDDVGHQFCCSGQGLLAVRGITNGVLRREQRTHIRSQVGIIFHDKHALLGAIIVRFVVETFLHMRQHGRVGVLLSVGCGLAHVSYGQRYGKSSPSSRRTSHHDLPV